MSAKNTAQTAIRLPVDLIARLDRVAERMQREMGPGANVTRSMVLRMALARGLDEMDSKGGRHGKA